MNSSHHQAADVVGDGLRTVARCPEDGVIEAVEGTSPDHFVLAVQWHPERSVENDESSRAIFRALIEAAQARHEEIAGEFESVYGRPTSLFHLGLLTPDLAGVALDPAFVPNKHDYVRNRGVVRPHAFRGFGL